MLENLLRTKLYVPKRPGGANGTFLVPRPHLIEKLNAGLTGKLTLVSAPAGYGKTTLVSEWIAQIQGDTAVCWLSLDEDDSDPQTFFHYLAAAVRPLLDGESSLSQLLQANQPLPTKTLTKMFVHDVTAVSTPFIFVLDDYHAIDSPDIDTALAFLLDRMPPHMTLALTSRSDPGFPISRLRARGQLTELRADDLRFTEAEAAQFLQQTMGLTLQPAQIAALENRTEGWIAGLQMAALSMQNRSDGDLDGFVQSFTGSHRFIMDYLTDEVLAQASPEVHAFLLQTAVLHRLHANLCEAIMPEAEAQQILEQLEATNTFLIPLDDERRWYRYHHLFADLLRQKVPDATAQTVRQKAAVWCAANGLVEDAIEYAIGAGVWETAVPLLAQNGLTYLFQGKLNRLRRWYEAFPTDLLMQQPRLCLDYAWVLVNQGEKNAVEPYLLAAETAAHGAPDVRGVTAIIRANNARAFENLPVMQAEAELALALIPPDRAVARCTALAQLGIVQFMAEGGDLAEAVRLLEETAVLARQSQNMNTAFLAGGCLGLAHLLRGEVGVAADVLLETHTFAIRQGLGQSPLLSYVHLGLAHLAFLAGELDAARQEITQVDAYCRFANEMSCLLRGSMLSALVEQAAGNQAGVDSALAELARLAAPELGEEAISLKNPELSRQVAFFQELLVQSRPSPGQLEMARLLAAGASLTYAQAAAQLEAAAPEQPLVDPLSERELEILQLIAAGLKNKEIAEQLFISLNTVLYHNKNIYGKLGVSKRTVAVSKARELGLV